MLRLLAERVIALLLSAFSSVAFSDPLPPPAPPPALNPFSMSHNGPPGLVKPVANSQLPELFYGVPFYLDVSPYFVDPAGARLTYSMKTSADERFGDGAGLRIDPYLGIIDGSYLGDAAFLSVTVTATGGNGSTTAMFTLSTNPPPVPTSVDDVGVIPETPGACPAGSPYLWLYNDDEDHNNNNSTSGWIGAITVNGGNTGTRFGFCRVSGSGFKQHPFLPYAVAKIGSSCPNGSQAVTRQFLNEVNNNQNDISGNFNPNSGPKPYTYTTKGGSGGDSLSGLVFCVFEGRPALPGDFGQPMQGFFPDFGIAYGVFAPSDPAWVIKGGSINEDNEDDIGFFVNSYQLGSSSFTDPPLPGFAKYVSGVNNTYMSIAKVRNKTMTCLNPVHWWNNTAITAPFDGTGCLLVQNVPIGSSPFIYNNNYYIISKPTTNCPLGVWDTKNCFYRVAPPGNFIFNNAFYVTPGPGSSCPAGSTFDTKNCFFTSAPFGTQAFKWNGNWYTTTQPTCPMGGTFDSRNCFMGTPPPGTTATIIAGKFYYLE